MATNNPNQNRSRKLSGSQGAGGQDYGGRDGSKGGKEAGGQGGQGKGGKEFGGGRTRGGQDYALQGKGREYTGEDEESDRPTMGEGGRSGPGGQRGDRLRSKRDPSDRQTSKPDVTLEKTSQTAILRTCADTLNETFAYCIEQGGEHVEGDHLKCLIDTAELCAVTANFVARGSEMSDDLLQVCAESCKCVEEHCEQFGDDEHMKACADVCRECYEHCSAQAAQKVA